MFPLIVVCVASLSSLAGRCMEVGGWCLGGLGPRRQGRRPFRVSLARGWGQGPGGAYTMLGGWRV